MLAGEKDIIMVRKCAAAIIAAALIMTVFSVMVSCDHRVDPEETAESGTAETLESVRERIKYIIHGAGKLAGHNLYGESKYFTCSNSMEGFRQCLDAGCEFVETDFSFTSDGELVCIHDWYPSYSDDIEFEGDVLSLDSFLNTRIFRQYTPVSLDMLAEILVNNRGLYIITDIKDDNTAGLKYIAEKYPDLRNRFCLLFNWRCPEIRACQGTRVRIHNIYALQTGLELEGRYRKPLQVRFGEPARRNNVLV